MNTQKQHEDFLDKHFRDKSEFEDLPALYRGVKDMKRKFGIAVVLVLIWIVGLIGWGLWSIIY